MDRDCPTNACCIQIGPTYRKCQTDKACTLHWTTLPPSSIPQWQFSEFANYTGNFDADVVHSRIVELIQSDAKVLYKLDNGQYWLNDLASGAAIQVSSGDECWVVPGKSLYELYVGDSKTPTAVRQIPVVLDTDVVAPFRGMTMEGIYQLEGAGYWKVFEASRSTDPRTLLASPNNKDYWIFTASTAENAVDPVAVRGDSTITAIESNGFVLANGQAWAYYTGSSSLFQPAVGDHVVIYDQTLVDDNQPDLPLLQTTWIEGKSMGELLLVTEGR